MSTYDPNRRFVTAHHTASAHTLGWIAIALAVIAPYAALPLAVVARRRARAAGIDSAAADWGWILSVSLTAVFVMVIIGGFVASVVIPVLR